MDKQTGYRHRVKKGCDKFPPENNRYHLYVCLACPWAHRTLTLRALKGLQDVISISVVHPTFQKSRPNDPKDSHYGWKFSDEALKNSLGYGSFKVNGTIPDTVLNKKFLREVYESVGDTKGPFNSPMLFDKKTKQIVNNESQDIMEILNEEFNDFAKNPRLNLNASNLLQAQAKLDNDIYDKINQGVYTCGGAQNQKDYDKAMDELFTHLDFLEDLLSKQKYLTGNQLTLSDIKLWVTLIRFDEVYVVYFKTNRKQISQYPNLLNYCRDIYQIQGVKETVNFEHIKVCYFSSQANLNYYGIVPQGPGFEKSLQQPHDRNKFTQSS